MATYSNQSKSVTILTNVAFGGAQRTWDQAVESWDANTGTWFDPSTTYARQSKSVTIFINQTKN